jgi:hypothetical protein
MPWPFLQVTVPLALEAVTQSLCHPEAGAFARRRTYATRRQRHNSCRESRPPAVRRPRCIGPQRFVENARRQPPHGSPSDSLIGVKGL